MPRLRKYDPQAIVRPLVKEFADQIASTVEVFIKQRVGEQVKKALESERVTRRGKPRVRPVTLCYVPGCKNLASPRHGMVCATTHGGMPKTKKMELRSKHRVAVAKRVKS